MRCETLEDVNLSCKAALDILNDLLCFDKLESGILVLHKQDMPILPFISNCVNMFQVQAREIGVTMKIINTTCMDQGPGPMSMQFNKCYPITDTETIYIDKFKMDQVIRNILSNALKFTPRNGTVSVSVMYDPQNFLQNKDAYKSPLRKAKSQIFRDINTFFGCVLPFSSPPPSNQIYALDDALENGKSRSFDETSDCGHLVISVIDSGAGISEENQKRLFHNIVQFNPEILQSGGGSGLGLWITKGIVDLHSGHIDVHSDGEGLGSVFTIRIPMWRHRTNSVESFSGSDVCDDALSLPAEEKDRNISRCGSSHNLSIMSKPSSKYPSFDLFPPNIPMTDYIPPSPERFSPVKDATFHPTHWSPRSSIIAPAPVLGPGTKFEILVVDDSRLNRKMLCKMLTSAGYCCDEAEDGLMAISKVRDRLDIAGCGNGSGGGILTGTDLRSYDAILMDFVMPNLDGPGATKIIRAMGYNGPIYGVTGNALEGDIQYFLDCGAVRIFTKPLDFPLLQECLTHALTPSHMRIANASCDENFI